MSTTGQSLQPDEDAQQLTERMLSSDDTMRRIIAETLKAGENGVPIESGRTVCPRPGEILKPQSRFPTSVELELCPVGTSGTWHTHVTRDQLRNPVNSLPDIANVVFGETDVSVVAGTQTAHAVIAPTDTETLQAQFRNVTGLEVSSAPEVGEAVMDRRVDPVATRQKVLSVFDGLTTRGETGYTDLDRRVDTASTDDAPPMEQQDAFRFMRAAQQQAGFTGAVEDMCNSFDAAGTRVSQVIPGGRLKNQALSTTTGLVIGRVVERVLFGD
jgi:hypothetical protein